MKNLLSRTRNLHTAVRLLLPMTLCFLSLLSCQSERNAEDQGAEQKITPSRRETVGERLYHTYCSGCHGTSGEGDGLHSYTLYPLPVNHADSTYMNTLSNTYLFDVISKGGAALGKSPEMPGWGHVLHRNQVLNIVVCVRSLPNRQSDSSESEANP